MHAGSIPARASIVLGKYLPIADCNTTAMQADLQNAALAQVVEHIIRNDGVRGSSPLSGTILYLKAFPSSLICVPLKRNFGIAVANSMPLLSGKPT